jgi:hypothetical protein
LPFFSSLNFFVLFAVGSCVGRFSAPLRSALGIWRWHTAHRTPHTAHGTGYWVSQIWQTPSYPRSNLPREKVLVWLVSCFGNPPYNVRRHQYKIRPRHIVAPDPASSHLQTTRRTPHKKRHCRPWQCVTDFTHFHPSTAKKPSTSGSRIY